MSSLKGKVVLITGGARGVGAATARRLVAQGAKVVLVDLDREPLAALEAELGAGHATAIAGDVCSLEDMEAAVAHGVATFGGLDVAMANAGIASYGSVLAVDPATFRRVVDVNLNGVFHTVRAALPALIERKGYVLVVSSLAAYAAAPGLVAYNASKAGAEHFANALRPEVGYLGVKVGSAHMGWIDTPLVQDAKKDLTAFGKMLDGVLSTLVLVGSFTVSTSITNTIESLAPMPRLSWPVEPNASAGGMTAAIRVPAVEHLMAL